MGLPPITPAPRRFLLQSSQTPKPTATPGHAFSSSQFVATPRFAGTPKFSLGSSSTFARKERGEEIDVGEGGGEDQDEVHDDDDEEAEHEEQAGALASDEREIVSPSLPQKSFVPESLKPIPARRAKGEEIEESPSSEDVLQQPQAPTNKDNHPSTPPQPPSSKRRRTLPPPPHLAENLEAIQISSSPSLPPTPTTPPSKTVQAELSDGGKSPPQDDISTPSKHHHTSISRPSFIFSPLSPHPPLGNPTHHPTPLIDTNPTTTNPQPPPPPPPPTNNLPPLPTRRPAYILPAAPTSPSTPSTLANDFALSKIHALLLSPHKSKSGKEIKYAAGGLASTVRGWVLDLAASGSADVRGRGHSSAVGGKGKGKGRTAGVESGDDKEYWEWGRVKVKDVRQVDGFGGGGGGGGGGAKGWFVDAEEEDGYDHDRGGTYKKRRRWFLVGNGIGMKKGERVHKGDVIGIGPLNWEVKSRASKQQLEGGGEHAEEPVPTPAVIDNVGEEVANGEDLVVLAAKTQSRSNEEAGGEEESEGNDENDETWRVAIEWKVLFSQPSLGIG